MSKSLVRQAISTDFPILLSIDKASFEACIAYDSVELSYFMRRNGAETLVAEVDGEIVGFILLETRPRRRSATMVTLDVLEGNRRQGIATQLLTASEELLRKKNVLRYELQVDVNNAGAMKFYKKHGFEGTQVLTGYYCNGNDAYLMVKNLA